MSRPRGPERRRPGRSRAVQPEAELPTGDLNQIALSSGWGTAYARLADEFDELYTGPATHHASLIGDACHPAGRRHQIGLFREFRDRSLRVIEVRRKFRVGHDQVRGQREATRLR